MDFKHNLYFCLPWTTFCVRDLVAATHQHSFCHHNQISGFSLKTQMNGILSCGRATFFTSLSISFQQERCCWTLFAFQIKIHFHSLYSPKLVSGGPLVNYKRKLNVRVSFYQTGLAKCIPVFLSYGNWIVLPQMGDKSIEEISKDFWRGTSELLLNLC